MLLRIDPVQHAEADVRRAGQMAASGPKTRENKEPGTGCCT